MACSLAVRFGEGQRLVVRVEDGDGRVALFEGPDLARRSTSSVASGPTGHRTWWLAPGRRKVTVTGDHETVEVGEVMFADGGHVEVGPFGDI